MSLIALTSLYRGVDSMARKAGSKVTARLARDETVP